MTPKAATGRPRMCLQHGSVFEPPGGYVVTSAADCPLTPEQHGDEPHGDAEVGVLDPITWEEWTR